MSWAPREFQPALGRSSNARACLPAQLHARGARAPPARPRLACRGSVEEAAEAVERTLALFGARQLDEIAAFLPDAVIDACLERRRAARAAAAEALGRPGAPAADDDGGDGSITFQELMSAARPEELILDAYAQRGLVCAPPTSGRTLSALRPESHQYLQRVAVTAGSGEEMVLTFQLQLQESLQPQYRGIMSVESWFLRGITGEPADPEPPASPSPSCGPESVVSAQLEALEREDAAGVFAFASPDNQSATGPLPSFEGMLRSGAYLSLFGHQGAVILRSVQTRCDRALVIVGVTASEQAVAMGARQRAVFAWVVGLQQGPGAGPLQNCWLTEAVQPISGGLYGEYAPGEFPA